MAEPRRVSVWGYVAAALCAAGAVVVYARQAAYRGVEARIEAFLINELTSVHTLAVPQTSTVFTGLGEYTGMGGYTVVGTGPVMGFTITPECSSAVLVAGFLALTAVALTVRRWSWSAVWAALGVAVAVVVAANLIRLSVVIGSTRVWNDSGYEWSHVYVGTFITLFGLIIALIAYVKLLGARPLTRRVRVLP